MTATAVEKRRSLRDGDSAEIEYLVRGTSSNAAAITAVLGVAPSTYEGLVLRNVGAVDEFITAATARCIMIGTAYYQSPDREKPEAGDEPRWAFDISGQTQRIVQSRSATAYHPGVSGSTALANGANIGDNGESVEGVDVFFPASSRTQTYYLAANKVTEAYRARVEGLVGTVNDDSYGGRAAGEVLFLGASGSQRGSGPWEVTYKYAISKNVTGETVADGDGGTVTFDKGGWEYFDARWETAIVTDGGIKEVRQVLKRVIIHEVYPEADFDELDPDWTT